MWGDVDQNTLNNSDIYKTPDAVDPIAFPGSSAQVFCLKDFENFKTPFFVTTINWLGSMEYWGKKWYLGYRYIDSGDKDGQDVDFVWSLGYPVNFPALVYDYYSAINKGKLEEAYSIWHKKQDFDYFKSLYSNVKRVLPIEIKNLGNNSWKVVTSIEFSDSTSKTYEVDFQLSEKLILDSKSTEINNEN